MGFGGELSCVQCGWCGPTRSPLPIESRVKEPEDALLRLTLKVFGKDLTHELSAKNH